MKKADHPFPGVSEQDQPAPEVVELMLSRAYSLIFSWPDPETRDQPAAKDRPCGGGKKETA